MNTHPTLVRLEGPSGPEYVNPADVVNVTSAIRDPKTGAPMLNMVGVILRSGQPIAVKGSAAAVASIICGLAPPAEQPRPASIIAGAGIK